MSIGLLADCQRALGRDGRRWGCEHVPMPLLIVIVLHTDSVMLAIETVQDPSLTLAALSSGMSDILSPFLVVFPNSDALAYMCFSALMNNIRQNFLEGQPGIHISIQHIGSLLQRVDKKLWRQIGNVSFTLHCSVRIVPHALSSWIRSTRSGKSKRQFDRVWQLDKALT